MIWTAAQNTMGTTMDRAQLMRFLREHLADFPVPYIADMFEKNGCADEKQCPDRVKAADDQAKRAREVMESHQVCFDSKQSMNTLLVVFSSPLSVSRLMRAAYADTDERNRISHVFIIRLGDVFLLLLTGSTYQRFPLAKFMCAGEHASAYLYLNLKEACWAPYNTVAPTLQHVLMPPKTKKQKRFQTLSQATLSGLHVLSVFWRRAALLQVNAKNPLPGGFTPVEQHYIYKQPRVERLGHAELQRCGQKSHTPSQPQPSRQPCRGKASKPCWPQPGWNTAGSHSLLCSRSRSTS